MAGAIRAAVDGSSEAVGSSSRRIGCGTEKGTSQGQPLALARAEREAVLAQAGGQPVGQMGHQLVEAHRTEHVVEFLIGGLGCTEAQVLGYRGREEVRPLRHPREVRPPLPRWWKSDGRDPIDRHGARRGLGSNPRSAPTTVDLPAPEGPTRATR